MRLLICTQTVDKHDPFLGFFHEWIVELAKHCESIVVVCLKESESSLPSNVKVYSLGKEARSEARRFAARLKYIYRFYKYIWSLHHEYDTVFVHMNQEYVLLGGLWWKMLGKKVFLWRNHYAGSWLTNIASFFCDKIFCTSKHSYTAKYKKTVLMPVGADINIFRGSGALSRMKHSILFLGRITPSKRPDIFIEALVILKERGVPFTATLCGPVLTHDNIFATKLRERVNELGMVESVSFVDGVSHDATSIVYASHEVFVDLSRSGMYNKTLFEASASGCLVVSMSDDFNDRVDDRLYFDGTAEDLANTIEKIFVLPIAERVNVINDLQKFAVANSLQKWGERVVSEMLL